MLNDYSGELLADIDLGMFTKEALIDLLELYGKLWLATDGFWYLTVKERLRNEDALACDLSFWEKYSKYEAQRLTKIMGIKGNDVAAFIKNFQVSPWFRNLEHKLEIKTRNHILLTVVNCPTLLALEKEGEGRENSI